MVYLGIKKSPKGLEKLKVLDNLFKQFYTQNDKISNIFILLIQNTDQETFSKKINVFKQKNELMEKHLYNIHKEVRILIKQWSKAFAVKKPKISLKEIPANKTNLNKIIKWSSSKFNQYTKPEVVNEMLRLISSGKNVTKTYATGGFSKSYKGAKLANWSYTFKIQNNVITLHEKPSNIKYKLIKKKK